MVRLLFLVRLNCRRKTGTLQNILSGFEKGCLERQISGQNGIGSAPFDKELFKRACLTLKRRMNCEGKKYIIIYNWYS